LHIFLYAISSSIYGPFGDLGPVRFPLHNSATYVQTITTKNQQSDSDGQPKFRRTNSE